MKKQSKLLKVFSIILIVLGALSLLSSIAGVAMMGMMEEILAPTGIAAPSIFSYVLSIVGSLVILGAGIVGVAYKSKQMVLVAGIVLAIYYIVNIIYSITLSGFSAFGLVSLIWPILYLWGWYQSN